MSSLPVLILVGGLGTRLKSVVCDLPKPMAPVGGKPFLEWQIEMLRDQGFKRVTLLTGYRSDAVEGHFRDGSRWDMQIDYSIEKEPLGTGGAIAAAIRNRSESEFLVMNGDSLLFTDLSQFAKGPCSESRIALHYQQDLRRFGRVEFDRDMRVTKFAEKSEQLGDGYINAGVYLIAGRAKNLILEKSGRFSLEKDILEPLSLSGTLTGQICPGSFIDIGIPESFSLAQTVIPLWFKSEKRPCLFLDRDGTLIKHVNYLHRCQDVEIIPETMEMIRLANRHQWHVVMVTNQSGVARGLFTVEDCNKVHEFIDRNLAESDLRISRWYASYYHPTEGKGQWKRDSEERKPRPGMILRACEDFEN
jgi:histidinol-phosphate phosphatase family protein